MAKKRQYKTLASIRDIPRMTRSQFDKENNKLNRHEKKKVSLVKFFEKHIVEKKTIVACSKELGLCKKTLHTYKNSEDFRQMALVHFDETELGGVKGTTTKLIDMLDATRPVVITDKHTDGETRDVDETSRIEYVADQKTRMSALREVIKIYGLYAPERKDVNVGISISSDADLFNEIEKAERSCRSVSSIVTGTKGLEMVKEESESSSGSFESRERILLQTDTIPEP